MTLKQLNLVSLFCFSYIPDTFLQFNSPFNLPLSIWNSIRSGLTLFESLTDADTATPTSSELASVFGDFLQAFSFWYGRLAR